MTCRICGGYWCTESYHSIEEQEKYEEKDGKLILKKDPNLICPECGAELIECIGEYEGTNFDGVKCPNGCNLANHYR